MEVIGSNPIAPTSSFEFWKPAHFTQSPSNLPASYRGFQEPGDWTTLRIKETFSQLHKTQGWDNSWLAERRMGGAQSGTSGINSTDNLNSGVATSGCKRKHRSAAIIAVAACPSADTRNAIEVPVRIHDWRSGRIASVAPTSEAIKLCLDEFSVRL